MLLQLREMKVLLRCTCCNEYADSTMVWRAYHKNVAFDTHGDCENRHLMQFFVLVLITLVKCHNTKRNKVFFWWYFGKS